VRGGYVWVLRICPHPPFAMCDIASVYAAPRATTSRKPTSFHAQTHIVRHEYISSELVGMGGAARGVRGRARAGAGRVAMARRAKNRHRTH